MSNLVRPAIFVRFQVFTVASMKMASFWDIAPCSVVEVYTDVSELSTASIIRAIHRPDEEGAISHKAVICLRYLSLFTDINM
jgi:hypothetical protein